MGFVPEWRNRQTRRTQNPLGATPCGFDSRLRHQRKRQSHFPRLPLFFFPTFFTKQESRKNKLPCSSGLPAQNDVLCLEKDGQAMHDEFDLFWSQCLVKDSDFVQETVPPVAHRNTRGFGTDKQGHVVLRNNVTTNAVPACAFLGIQLAIEVQFERITRVYSSHVLPLPWDNCVRLITGN